MRKSFILAASLGTMLISSAAFAATVEMSGFIKSINFKNDTITLTNGKTFKLPTDVAPVTLAAGEKVDIVYHVAKGNHLVATMVDGFNTVK